MKAFRKAERLFETFHQFEPVKVGSFRRGFKIPRDAQYVGEAKTMYYTSDKLNPESGEDEGWIRYFHEHEGRVRMYVCDRRLKRFDAELRQIPKWIYNTKALVRIGDCDGFDYIGFDGKLKTADAVGAKPEWYAVPSGKALLVIQDKQRVLAIVWGGSLRVEWRGVVG